MYLNIMVHHIFFCIIAVSKTTKELLLSWDQGSETEGQAVSVAEDLRMPQFEMQKITTNLCHETKYMGKSISLF